MTRSPGSSQRPRAASCSASQTTPAAGCPLAAAPVPLSTAWPSTNNVTGSDSSPVNGSSEPTATHAADEPSAVLSSSLNLYLDHTESTISSQANAASHPTSTSSTEQGTGSRRPNRHPIS